MSNLGNDRIRLSYDRLRDGQQLELRELLELMDALIENSKEITGHNRRAFN